MTLEELATRQQETGNEIKRICVNYKKDSPERKTLEYLNSKLKTLDALWTDFENSDNKIRIDYSSQLDHPYFTKEYYSSVKTGCDEIKDDILNRIEIIRNALRTSIEKDVQGAAPNTDAAEWLNNPWAKDDKAASNKTRGTAKQPSDNPKQTVRLTTSSHDSTTNKLMGLIRKQQSLIQAMQRALSSLHQVVPQSAQYYQIKIKTIEQYWCQIQDLHHTMWEQTSNPVEYGYNMEEYFLVEDSVQVKLVELYEAMNQTASNSTRPNTQFESPPITSIMKLPNITLPKFSGEYLQWRQFRDLFTELVHNQPIADCQKIWYLKTSLSGEAERLIRHLTMSDANYTIAWRILTERYENTRLLVSAVLNKLLGQSTICTESPAVIKSMHDTTQECLLALENLGISTTNWDSIVLHILLKRLDKNTHTLWEQSQKQPKMLQSIKDFLEFLENRFQSLEALGTKSKSSEDQHKKQNLHKTASSLIMVEPSCASCKGQHQLFACHKFLKMHPTSRLNFVRTSKLCFNCLKAGHNCRNCQSRGCTKCSRRHNTLLHLDNSTINNVATISDGKAIIKTSTASDATPPGSTNMSTAQTNTKSASLTANISQSNKGYVLLSTVMVRLSNNKGDSIECRALLDSGSQLNIVTDKIAKQLGLGGTAEHMSIEGIGQRNQKSKKRVTLTLESRVNAFCAEIEAYVLPQIISPQPTHHIDISSWSIPHNIALADPNFNKRAEIDLLIGAEIYYSILAIGQIRLNDGLPTLQNTVFGWTVAGKAQGVAPEQAICAICTEDERLREQIEKFWHLEEVEKPNSRLTSAERECESHFTQTQKRDASGRFIVRLPLRESTRILGESKDIAYKRFINLERKLNANEQLKQQYINFMKEYQHLEHMKEIDVNKVEKPYYFLPHHAVMKADSSTTKLRVVFDASAKTSAGVSLNDILHIGPTIQDDVFSILLRFRLPKFAFTADIEKMYRQIRLDERDQTLQLIWWRSDSTERLRCFQLSTVTYGTACAPYLAIKCLQTLAEEGADTHPLGSKIMKQNFYVDDVLAGSDSLAEAIEMQTQLQSLAIKGGFNLRKWSANHPRLLQGIPQEQKELQLDFTTGTEEHIKTMGLVWSPKTDSFRIRAFYTEERQITKRTVASDVAHLFDPLGIMSPVVVLAKLFSQKLWTLKLDWDAALPQEHYTYWKKFKEDLKVLNDITFPRHVFSQRAPRSMQLHIFTDASEKAYGAAAYIRAVDKDKVIIARLLCAKSRIAPLKQQTLPRLELCAANLGAELAHRIKTDLKLSQEIIYFWTDSEITLAWINSTSSSLQRFVANRVASIQQLSTCNQWRHVTSKENPADIVSRGLTPERLATSNLWFYGPTFLHGVESVWPAPYVKGGECVPEQKERSLTAVIINDKGDFIDTISHKGSFKRLQRIVAYMLRFINSARQGKPIKSSQALEAAELENSLKVIIQIIQKAEFKEDLDHLRRYGETARNSSMAGLTPFLDSENIMRVGGRLEASNLPYDAKHQILLPYTHPLTKIILKEIHVENLHAGAQTLLALTRQKFWPVKGKTLARSIVQNCVHCARAKPKLANQLMGNLPAHRVQPARPFVNAGVDFAGPVWTHFKIRGKRPQKTYIAVFCCFATKATHLELVSDLTTDGFIGALKRFMARRGHCRHIYCDNATNFVGAKNQLQEVKEVIESQKSVDKIKCECSSKGTDFHLIPPRAPHFGGLWEAAVKSAKHLLRSTLAAASLTYEELETVVTEVEAILNSRPLIPMSSDPNDLMAFTPGHFLIGEPITYSINAHAKPLKTDLPTRWKLVTHLKNEFWRRWQNEYLNHLQHRVKWKQPAQNIQPGTMVIIKEDNVPALQWKLGRIVQTFKGQDELIRVADVRTSSGIVRRAIHRLAPLPVESQDTNFSEVSTSQLGDKHQDKDNEETLSSTLSTYISTPQTRIEDEPNEDCPRQQDVKETIPRKRARRSLGKAVLTLLLTCILLPMTKCDPVEIRPFETEPGIYFENLGPANIISGEWNLVAYYEMKPYWREYEMLGNYSLQLKNICNLIEERKACSQINDQFKHFLDELSNNNVLLTKSQNTPRSKRGAINFVGTMANALFGVLDAEYAEKMSITIEKVQQNEVHLSSLIKNQTSLIDATINIMKKDQQAVSQQFQQLEAHIVQVTAKMNGIHQEMYQERLSQLFTSVAIQAMLLSSNFHRIQNALLDVMVHTHNGKISTQLISPGQLQKELMTIKEHLPASLKLPAKDDILSFYNVLTIEGRAEQKHIIFKIRVPLLASENFEIFHIVPVPVRINNTFIAIRPSFPFLMLNLHRDQYYPFTEQELGYCASLNGEGYLCKQKHPIYRKGSAISACEITFISQAQRSPECQIAKVDKGPHWIQLHTPNLWIYSLDEQTTINIVCSNNVTQYKIERSGLLKLQADCVMKQQLITIQGHNLASSITRLAYIPSINLSEVITARQLTPALRETHHYAPHLEELIELKKRVQEMDTDLPAKLVHNDTHQFSVSYLALCLTLALVTYLIWKYKVKCHNTKADPDDSKDSPTSVHNPTGRQPSIEDFTIDFNN